MILPPRVLLFVWSNDFSRDVHRHGKCMHTTTHTHQPTRARLPCPRRSGWEEEMRVLNGHTDRVRRAGSENACLYLFVVLGVGLSLLLLRPFVAFPPLKMALLTEQQYHRGSCLYLPFLSLSFVVGLTLLYYCTVLSCGGGGVFPPLLLITFLGLIVVSCVCTYCTCLTRREREVSIRGGRAEGGPEAS